MPGDAIATKKFYGNSVLSWDGAIALKRTLEQGVNKRRQSRPGKKDQRGKEQEQDENGQQPPFLVLAQETPQFAEETGVHLLLRGLFKIVLFWFAHKLESCGPERFRG
jgi:hypothetical protein